MAGKRERLFHVDKRELPSGLLALFGAEPSPWVTVDSFNKLKDAMRRKNADRPAAFHKRGYEWRVRRTDRVLAAQPAVA